MYVLFKGNEALESCLGGSLSTLHGNVNKQHCLVRGRMWKKRGAGEGRGGKAEIR